MSDKWQAIEIAARRVGVTRQAVHKRIGAGKMPAWKAGPKATLVRVVDVDGWIAERAGGPR